MPRFSAPAAAENAKSELTIRQVRALPWPATIRSHKKPLDVGDCYEVGRIIVEELGWSDTRGRQAWSLRRLKADVLKAASVSTLSRCVRVYRVAKDLDIKPPWRRLDMRHLVATASLPTAKRKALLQKADKEGWSALRLEQFVRESYGSPGRGGRTDIECVRALDELSKRDLFQDLARLKLYSKPELRRLAGRIDAARRELAQLREELRSLGV